MYNEDVHDEIALRQTMSFACMKPGMEYRKGDDNGYDDHDDYQDNHHDGSGGDHIQENIIYL